MKPMPFSERIRLVREANRLANSMVRPAPAYRGAPIMPISGMGWHGSQGPSSLRPFDRWLHIAGGAAATYHGYRRNQSVGWALAWGFVGGLFPVTTNVIGVAQGFGKRKKR